MDVTGWLLDSDPSIRWQTLRDLEDAPADVVAGERARVATEGWGARLLSVRDDDGQWAGGACFPGDHEGSDQPDSRPDGQPWTSTLHTLELLRWFGLDPSCAQAVETLGLVSENCRWEHEGQRFFDGEVEACINGRTVAIGAYFGQDVGQLAERLIGEQLDDGGWNCWMEYGAVRSSFHSTICVLEGLLAYEQATGSTASIEARRRAEEYLLERRLTRRLSTGEVVNPDWLQFSYPVRWHYDVLRALDYFRTTGDPPDKRTVEAVERIRSKRQPDGRWLLENTHPGQVHFMLEDGDGRPSRWNTLRALRVLRWYEQSRA
jgi:hypothetical protein